MTGWPARIVTLALATFAAFYVVPRGIEEVARTHHSLVIVPLAMWIIIPAALLFGTWFRPASWPPRSK